MARRSSVPSLPSEDLTPKFKRQMSDPEGRKIAEPKPYQETNPHSTVNSNLVVDRNGPIPVHIQRCTNDRLQRSTEASRSSRGDPVLEEVTVAPSYLSPNPNTAVNVGNRDKAALVCGGHSPPSTTASITANRALLTIAGLDISKDTRPPDNNCNRHYAVQGQHKRLSVFNSEKRSLVAVSGLELNNDTQPPGVNCEWAVTGPPGTSLVFLTIYETELHDTKIALRVRRGASVTEVMNHPMLVNLRQSLSIGVEKNLYTTDGVLLHPLHRFTNNATLHLR